MTIRVFSEETLQLLKNAGWFLGRDATSKLKLPVGFHIHSFATAALQEFAYLTVGQAGRGIHRARLVLTFDPMLALGEEDRFEEYANQVHSSLYPLGEVQNENYFIAIDEVGKIFLIMDNMIPIADNIYVAIEKLLLGK